MAANNNEPFLDPAVGDFFRRMMDEFDAAPDWYKAISREYPYDIVQESVAICVAAQLDPEHYLRAVCAKMQTALHNADYPTD